MLMDELELKFDITSQFVVSLAEPLMVIAWLAVGSSARMQPVPPVI